MGDVTDEKSAVIRAASGTDKDVYFIGPHGSRVSFASQQRRVLNLIWALRETSRFPNPSGRVRVAVIGAGFAGTMAVAALTALDYDVLLFEEHGHALNLQETASHRHVHPTINFWPYDDLHWTTKLPFFDWYASSSLTVVRTLFDRWTKEFLSACVPVFNSPVSAVAHDPMSNQVVVTHAGGSESVDIAFVATGFGKEDDLGDYRQASYWKIDDANLYVTSNETLLVSGIGDGGLIDSLRLVYQHFMEDEVALRYLLAIDSESMRKAVRNIERDAEHLADRTERAEFLEGEYRDLARKRPAIAKNKLKAPHDGKPKVALLIGKSINPFEGAAAPIHKLILAHTLNEGWIEYRPGTLVRDKKTGHYFFANGRSRRKVKEQVVIVRHGATPPLAKLVGEPQAALVKTTQQNLGNFMRVLEMAPDYFNNLPHMRSFARNSPYIAVDRLPLAEEIMKDRFLGSVDVVFDPPGEARYRAAPIGASYSSDFGPRPRELFNVEVIEKPPGVMRVNPQVATYP